MDLNLEKYLIDLTGRYSTPFKEALLEMVVGKALPDKQLYFKGKTQLNEVFRETLGIGELLGAYTVLRYFAREIGLKQRFAKDRVSLLTFASSSPQNLLPRVTLKEAVEDLLERTPKTIYNAAERTYMRIAQLYSEGHYIAFVKSAEDAVTEKARQLISEGVKKGVPEAEMGRLLRLGVDKVKDLSEDWVDGYSRMVFRTNINTAVSAGRFRQVQDPTVRRFIPAFQFQAVIDSETRPNHKAADGLIFEVTNPVWNKISPPLGYNCRCQLVFLSQNKLKRMGRLTKNSDVLEDRLPVSAHPDPLFRHGGRPDLFLLSQGGL